MTSFGERFPRWLSRVKYFTRILVEFAVRFYAIFVLCFIVVSIYQGYSGSYEDAAKFLNRKIAEIILALIPLCLTYLITRQIVDFYDTDQDSVWTSFSSYYHRISDSIALMLSHAIGFIFLFLLSIFLFMAWHFHRMTDRVERIDSEKTEIWEKFFAVLGLFRAALTLIVQLLVNIAGNFFASIAIPFLIVVASFILPAHLIKIWNRSPLSGVYLVIVLLGFITFFFAVTHGHFNARLTGSIDIPATGRSLYMSIAFVLYFMGAAAAIARLPFVFVIVGGMAASLSISSGITYVKCFFTGSVCDYYLLASDILPTSLVGILLFTMFFALYNRTYYSSDIG